MAIERSAVSALHHDVNTALTAVASKHGFTFQPSGMRYTDADVSGRIRFVLNGKQTEVASRSNVYAVNGHKVGDTVMVQGEAYTIEKFTARGGSRITRTRDGKRFRCSQMAYEKDGKAAGLTDAQIRSVIKRVAPGLNANATKRMLLHMRWAREKVVLHDVNSVRAWVQKQVDDAHANAAKHPIPGSNYDGIHLLNESADEAAWEAKVS